MTLAPGTRLGPYEILASLGAGGMGEVFRARDTKLSRDVALKVLPDHLRDDPKALARFEAEARAVAALSHPHILAIHDFGRIDGTSFAVTELLEGETLRALLLRGPVPPRRALEIARPLADALAAAHAKGIVHRDLKPENVFLTRDGLVKLLDFGLARHSVAALAPEDARSPTAPVLTGSGTVLGTVAYMSPEQARGLPADHRSDQFSLGVVLYEMLSGRRPFRGDSVAETLAAIIREEPEPFAESASAVPEGVRLLVDRLLAKDPADRYDSTRDLARDVEALMRSPWLPERPLSGPRRRRGRAAASVRRLRAAATLLLVVVAAASAWLLGGRSRSDPAPGAPGFDLFERVTSTPGAEGDPALSPDGATLAFTRDGDVWVQRVGGLVPANLTGDFAGYDGEPAWSPDGRRIAFRSERDGGGIYVMGAAGESVRRVTSWGRSPAWYPDGRRLVVTSCRGAPYSVDPSEGELRSVEIDSGTMRTLARVFAFDPRVSPSGQRVAFCGTRPGDFRRDVYTVSAEPGPAPAAPVPVTSDVAVDWSPVWTGDGRSLVFASDRGGTLNAWSVAVDEETGRPGGPPEPVALPSRSTAQLDRSWRADRLAFTSEESVWTIEALPFDPVAETVRGAASVVFRSSTSIGNLRASRRGDLLAFNSFGKSDLWVVRTDGSGLRQLTDDVPRDYFPSFTPDGRRIVFQSDRGERIGVWAIGVDGSSPVCLADAPGKPGWPTLSPDGRTIAVTTEAGPRLLPIEIRRGQELPPPIPGLPDGRGFLPDAWSPDGRRLSGLLVRPDGARGGVAILDVAQRTYRVVSETGGRSTFLSDGRRLLLADGGALVVVDTGSGRRKTVLPVDSGRRAGFPALAPDDRTIWLLRVDVQSDIWLASRVRSRPGPQ